MEFKKQGFSQILYRKFEFSKMSLDLFKEQRHRHYI